MRNSPQIMVCKELWEQMKYERKLQQAEISQLQAANTQLTAALALAIERFGEMGTGLDTRTEHKMPELDPEETYLSGYKDLRSMSEHAYQIRDEIKKIWNPNEPR